MKTRILTLFLAAATVPAFAQTADEFYRRGMEAVSRGDADAARASFSEALRLRPDHPYARYQLGQLRGQTAHLTAKRREAQLAAVTLPNVDFRDVGLSEALAALGLMIEQQTKKGEDDAGFSPNFMVQDPSGQLAERPVSLQLKGIPAKAALDYLLQQTGSTARFDEHAIVIRPAGSPAAAAAPAQP